MRSWKVLALFVITAGRAQGALSPDPAGQADSAAGLSRAVADLAEACTMDGAHAEVPAKEFRWVGRFIPDLDRGKSPEADVPFGSELASDQDR